MIKISINLKDSTLLKHWLLKPETDVNSPLIEGCDFSRGVFK